MALHRRWAPAARLDRPAGPSTSRRSAAPPPLKSRGTVAEPAGVELLTKGWENCPRQTPKPFSSSPLLQIAENCSGDSMLNATVSGDENTNGSSRFSLLLQNIGDIERILAGRDLVMLELEILRHIDGLGAQGLFHEYLWRATEVTVEHEPQHPRPLDEQNTALIVRTGRSTERKVNLRRRKPSTASLEHSKTEATRNRNHQAALAGTEAEISNGLKDLLVLERTRVALEAEIGQPVSYALWAEAANVDQTTLKERLRFGWHCRDKLLKSTLSLVKYIGKSYRGMGIAFDDIIQAGKIGVLNGAERFDSTKGYKFSTYVQYWIKKAILKLVAQHSRTIQLTARAGRMVFLVQKARREVKFRTGRHPGDDEVADITGLSVSDVQLATRCSVPPCSIDRYIGNGCTKQMEVIEDSAVQSPYEAVERMHRKKGLLGIVERLEPRERWVIQLRYGLGDGRRKSLVEIGQLFCKSKEWVRKVEKAAMKKLRRDPSLGSFTHLGP